MYTLSWKLSLKLIMTFFEYLPKKKSINWSSVSETVKTYLPQ